MNAHRAASIPSINPTALVIRLARMLLVSGMELTVTVLQIVRQLYMGIMYVMQIVIQLNVILMKGIAYVLQDVRLLCYPITSVMLYAQLLKLVTLIILTAIPNVQQGACEVR